MEILFPHGPANLKFGAGNAKLDTRIATFSLPAGHSCPFARECFSKADKLTGKLIDGKHCRFRCFAASQEAAYPNVRAQRWQNYSTLKNESSINKMATVIENSLPGSVYVRVHVSGDFFSEKYFLAWLEVAKRIYRTTFYGYTKALPFLTAFKKSIPPNLRFTASRGGTHDDLIKRHNLRSAEVVFSNQEAVDKGLEIDHDDSHAILGQKSFALLIHGTQPKGSEASVAWHKIKNTIGGYSRGRDRQKHTQQHQQKGIK